MKPSPPRYVWSTTDVSCDFCGARVGSPCVGPASSGGVLRNGVHSSRLKKFQARVRADRRADMPLLPGIS